MGVEGRRLTRTTHSKSRRGCVTCKQRHVKCDETQPACQQCQKVGKECAGYQDEKDLKFRWRRRESSQLIFKNTFCPSPPTSESPSPTTTSQHSPTDTSLTVPSPSPLAIPRRSALPVGELFALEYFHAKTVPLLSSFIPSQFWTRLVPIISESAPSIRHCLLAIGSWHADEDFRNATGAATRLAETSQSAYSCNQYGRALQSLQAGLLSMSDQNSRLVALLASLLFVVYESLRGRRVEMEMHLRHGLSIAREGFDDSVAPPERFLVELMLGRLGMSHAMYDQHPVADDSIMMSNLLDVEPRSNGFSSFESCTAMIHNISNDIVRFIWAVTNERFSSWDSKVAEQQKLQARCEAWTKQVAALGLLSVDTPGAKILRARQELANTMIKVCHTLYQTSYDLHIDAFRRIVNLCASALQRDPQDPKAGFVDPGAFSVDLGIISLLAYTARLCRHRTLRRDALNLLKYCPRRESVWRTDDAIAVTNVIIEYEERRALGMGVGEMPIIPESDRVHLVRSQTYVDADGDTMLDIILMIRPEAGVLQLTDVPVRVRMKDKMETLPL